jgi:hypothetical protein
LKQVDFDGKETFSQTISALVLSQDRLLLKRINLLGEDVTGNFSGEGIVIEIYEDGSAKKIFYRLD